MCNGDIGGIKTGTLHLVPHSVILFSAIPTVCMQHTFLTILLILASLTVVPMTTLAQETTETGSGMTVEESGSGRTLRDMLDAIQTTLGTPKDATPSTIAVDEKLLQEWQTESVRMRKRITQNRQDCAEAIRRANRDTLMETAARCVRNDLLQETALLRAHQEVLDATPLSSEATRLKVQEAMTAFTDASTAILNAIDAGLFRQMDTLRQATRNLHTQYRQTLHSQYTLLRLERERTWMLSLRDRMSALREADPAADALLLPGALCLADAATLLQGKSGTGYGIGSTDHLQIVRIQNNECRILMQQAVSAARTPEKPLE